MSMLGRVCMCVSVSVRAVHEYALSIIDAAAHNHASNPSNQIKSNQNTGERKLTTKVFAVRTPLGAKIYFLPTMNVLGAGFREEKAIEKARMKGDGQLGPPKPTRPVLEGGLEVCIDEVPEKRVRVRRVAMEEGTVVKAMSEKELLESLRREIESVEALAAQGKRVTGGAGAAPPPSS